MKNKILTEVDTILKSNDEVSNDKLFELLEDLYGITLKLQQELEDIKQDMEDNWKPIPVEDQYDM